MHQCRYIDPDLFFEVPSSFNVIFIRRNSSRTPCLVIFLVLKFTFLLMKKKKYHDSISPNKIPVFYLLLNARNVLVTKKLLITTPAHEHGIPRTQSHAGGDVESADSLTGESPKIYSAFQWTGIGALIQSVIKPDV